MATLSFVGGCSKPIDDRTNAHVVIRNIAIDNHGNSLAVESKDLRDYVVDFGWIAGLRDDRPFDVKPKNSENAQSGSQAGAESVKWRVCDLFYVMYMNDAGRKVKYTDFREETTRNQLINSLILQLDNKEVGTDPATPPKSE